MNQYNHLLKQYIDILSQITCRKATKTGGLYPAAFVPLGMANTINRFSFQDSVDVDTKDEINRGKIYYIQLLAILINIRILNIS